MLAGIPGLVLLARFVHPGTRDPTFTVEHPRKRERLSTAALGLRAAVGGLLGLAMALVTMATMAELTTARENAAAGFDLVSSLSALIRPQTFTAQIQLLGSIVFGAACALLTAAVYAARHGASVDPPPPEEDTSP